MLMPKPKKVQVILCLVLIQLIGLSPLKSSGIYSATYIISPNKHNQIFVK